MVAGPIISIAMMEKQPSSEPCSPQQGTLGGQVSINDLFDQIQRGLERSEKRKPPLEQFRVSQQFESIRSDARRSNRSSKCKMDMNGHDNRSFLFGSQLRDSLLNTSYVPQKPKPAPPAALKFEPPRFNIVSSSSATSHVFSAVECSPFWSNNTVTTSCGESDSTCTNKNQLLWTPAEYSSSSIAPPGRSSSEYQRTRRITMLEIDPEVSSTSLPDEIIRSAGVSTSKHVTGSFLSELLSSKPRSQGTILPVKESEPASDDRQVSRTRTVPLDQAWQHFSSRRDERFSASSSTDNQLNELYTDTLQQLKEPTTQDALSTTSSFGSRRAASKRRPGGNISEASTSVNSIFRSIISSMKSTNSGLSSSVTLENDGIDTTPSYSMPQYIGNEAEEEELDKLVALARTCIPEDKKQRYE